MAITPILTRLYTPEDFGLLAVFVALTAILGSISSGRYELAIMLPENDEDSINIAALCFLLSISLSIIILIIITAFSGTIVNLLDNKGIKNWLYLVPFVVLMTGFRNTLNYLNTRKVLYKDIAKANIYKSVGLASVQLGVGFVKSGVTGLISGQVIANIISNYQLAKNVFKNYDNKTIKIIEIKRWQNVIRTFLSFQCGQF